MSDNVPEFPPTYFDTGRNRLSDHAKAKVTCTALEITSVLLARGSAILPGPGEQITFTVSLNADLAATCNTDVNGLATAIESILQQTLRWNITNDAYCQRSDVSLSFSYSGQCTYRIGFLGTNEIHLAKSTRQGDEIPLFQLTFSSRFHGR
jgi:hypothetical protein